MAFELLTEVPLLLRTGHVIRFDGQWPAAKQNQWFRVDRSWQVKYDVGRIVSSGGSQDLRFNPAAGSDPVDSTHLALIPTSPETVYELLMGIKGNMLVYPRYADRYLSFLEESTVQPDTTDEEERYLGFFDEGDSPFDAPVLREYVVLDQETPVLRLYNDGPLAEKIVLRFIVNRCRILPVDPSQLSETDRSRVRIAKYHSLTQW